MLRYDISPLDPEAHLFIVGITIPNPTSDHQLLRLPNWISGSYMIRDFCGTIQKESAYLGDTEVPVEKIDKNMWRIPTASRKEGEDLYVYYQVWAFDKSVRAAYLDDNRGFFNPGATFMQVIGSESEKIIINITPPVDELRTSASDWRVATGLKRAKGTQRFSWGLYEASSYDELIDCPVELGDFTDLTFKAHNVRHDVILTNIPANFSAERLLSDMKAICEHEISFFEPDTFKAPVKEYTFLINVTGNVRGGLEHHNSTALATPAYTLPCIHDKEPTKDYIDFLSLVSHEYFHTWNVKRIKPAEFIDSDFELEIPTTSLWFFEGITSYYDDLFLRRTDLITKEQYADLLSVNFKNVLESNARTVQSLAQASFDAWVKFYKPSANTPNAHVSYYKQGALAGLLLDIEIRKQTNGEKSLDDVMRYLWNQVKQAKSDYAGVYDESIAEAIFEATGCDLTEFLFRLIYTTDDQPYDEALKTLGLSLSETKTNKIRSMLGISGVSSDSGFTVTYVYDQEVAQWIGIAPGDLLIAIDGVRIKNNLEKLLERYAAGDQMVIHAFRDDSLQSWVSLIGNRTPVKSTVKIDQLTNLGKQWLHEA